jgi:hypothetical protein
MRLPTKLTVATVVAALAASPALAQPPAHPGPGGNAHPSKPGATGGDQPGPGASLPAKAKAYGSYCKDQSRRHVAGQKGTPFSQCVTAMAKLAGGASKSPQAACATMSKAHVAGEQGTPFSRCVAAGAKLLKSKQQNP